MNRRTFLGTFGALCAGAAIAPRLSAEVAPSAAPATPDAVFAFPPYAQVTGPATMDVRWRTVRPATGFLRWTQDPALPRDRWSVACRMEDGMIAANRCDHCVTLRGLDPVKPVCFEAVSEPIASFGAYSIKREAPAVSAACEERPRLGPNGGVCLAVLNDLHGNIGLIPKLLAVPAVVAAKPSTVLFNGDCVDDCGNQAGVEKRFLRALPPLTAQGLPALFLRGNHEYRGAMARRLRENLSPLENGRYYGVMTLGSVRFLFLDTGEDKPDTAAVYGGLLSTDAYIAEQAAWLAAEIASPEWKAAPWHVAVMHISPFCGDAREDGWFGPTRLREKIDPLLAQAGLNVLVGAHTHSYSAHPSEKTGRPYPIVIGGGPSEKSATVMLLQADAATFSLRPFRIDGSALSAIVAHR